eukprot:4235740-Pyramimonas_sp.AAC.1
MPKAADEDSPGRFLGFPLVVPTALIVSVPVRKIRIHYGTPMYNTENATNTTALVNDTGKAHAGECLPQGASAGTHPPRRCR